MKEKDENMREGYIKFDLGIKPSDVIAALKAGGVEKPTIEQVRSAIARLEEAASDVVGLELIDITRESREAKQDAR